MKFLRETNKLKLWGLQGFAGIAEVTRIVILKIA